MCYFNVPFKASTSIRSLGDKLLEKHFVATMLLFKMCYRISMRGYVSPSVDSSVQVRHAPVENSEIRIFEATTNKGPSGTWVL